MSEPIITQAGLDELRRWTEVGTYAQLLSPRETVARLLDLIAKYREALEDCIRRHGCGTANAFDLTQRCPFCEKARAALALVKPNG